MFHNAWVRLVGRAVIAGALVFFTQLSAADEPFSQSVLLGAAGAAVLAAVEILTPLNKLIGVSSPKP